MSVRPELSMNSSSPALMPFNTLMRIWSKRDLSDAKGPVERAPRGLTQEGRDQPPGRFIWHDVGVLAT
jgi:hypothetical protein